MDDANARRRGATARRLLVDSPTSIGAKARTQRWKTIESLFPELPDMTVIDLGGTVEAWGRAPVRPKRVTVVNLFEPGQSPDDWLVPIVGDACEARSVLRSVEAPDEYDLVFSNSLLEHVGGHAKRAQLAAEVRGLASQHWVQTPYRYFPVEPHCLFPLMQFLPLPLRVEIATRWPLVHTRPSSRADARSNVLWTELVSLTEMRAYFPDSDIFKENFCGLIKSISAVRTA